jgi:hypothetical protein
MTPEAINQALRDFFPTAKINQSDEQTWKVHELAKRFHLLVSLSDAGQLFRIFVPIASQEEADPYLPQLLEYNFNENKLVRYALSQNRLWGVFKYPLESLEINQLNQALEELINLHQQNLNPFFNQLADAKVREIIIAAKSQGHTMTMTMQTITRFYEEGIMGGLDQDPRQQKKALLAWQYQLERLWDEIA